MPISFDNRLSFLQMLACGGISGIIGRTLTAPLDVLKVLAQIGVYDSSSSIRTLILKVHLNDGFRGFWKGNLTGCMKIFPHSVVHFITFNQLKWTFSDELGRLSAWKATVAGTIAGVNATLVCYPVDVIKTRIIAQPLQKTKRTYTGILHALLTISRNEGIFTLYRGLSVTLAGCVPYAVSTYAVFELLDLVWMRPKYRITPFETVVQGSIASAVALTITFPFDVIRKKMQAKSGFLPRNGGVDINFKNGWECFKTIVVKNGRKGLWKGLLPAIIKVAPYNGFMFLSYEMCKRFSLYYNGYSESPFEETDTTLDQNIDLDEMQDISDYDIELDLRDLDDNEEDS